VHHYPIAFNSAIGFGDPVNVGGHRRESGFFVSVAWSHLYGWAVREGATPAGANYRFANLHGSAHPVWRRGAEITYR